MLITDYGCVSDRLRLIEEICKGYESDRGDHGIIDTGESRPGTKTISAAEVLVGDLLQRTGDSLHYVKYAFGSMTGWWKHDIRVIESLPQAATLGLLEGNGAAPPELIRFECEWDRLSGVSKLKSYSGVHAYGIFLHLLSLAQTQDKRSAIINRYCVNTGMLRPSLNKTFDPQILSHEDLATAKKKFDDVNERLERWQTDDPNMKTLQDINSILMQTKVCWYELLCRHERKVSGSVR